MKYTWPLDFKMEKAFLNLKEETSHKRGSRCICQYKNEIAGLYEGTDSLERGICSIANECETIVLSSYSARNSFTPLRKRCSHCRKVDKSESKELPFPGISKWFLEEKIEMVINKKKF